MENEGIDRIISRLDQILATVREMRDEQARSNKELIEEARGINMAICDLQLQ